MSALKGVAASGTTAKGLESDSEPRKSLGVKKSTHGTVSKKARSEARKPDSKKTIGDIPLAVKKDLDIKQGAIPCRKQSDVSKHKRPLTISDATNANKSSNKTPKVPPGEEKPSADTTSSTAVDCSKNSVAQRDAHHNRRTTQAAKPHDALVGLPSPLVPSPLDDLSNFGSGISLGNDSAAALFSSESQLGIEEIHHVIGGINLMNFPVKEEASDEKPLDFPSNFLEPFLANQVGLRGEVNGNSDIETSSGGAGPAVDASSTPASSQKEDLKIKCLLKAATSPSQRTEEDTLTYLNQGQTYCIKLSAKPGQYRSSLAIRLLHGKSISALIPQDLQSWERTSPNRSLIEIDKLASNQITQVRRVSKDGVVAFSWKTSASTNNSAVLAFRVNCLSTDFATHRRGEKGAFLQLELMTATGAGGQQQMTHKPVDVSTCLIKVFKGGAERRLKQDQEKVQKALLESNGKADAKVTYQGSQADTLLVQAADIQQLSIDPSVFEPEIKHESSTRRHEPLNFSNFIGDSLDQDEEECKDRFSARPRVALRINEQSTVWEVQQWLSENYFGDLKSELKNYNGHLLLSLEKSDFTQICGVAEGIRMYKTLRHGRESVDGNATSKLSVTTYTQTD